MYQYKLYFNAVRTSSVISPSVFTIAHYNIGCDVNICFTGDILLSAGVVLVHLAFRKRGLHNLV